MARMPIAAVGSPGVEAADRAVTAAAAFRDRHAEQFAMKFLQLSAGTAGL
jgi:hypothetical protein